MSADFDVIIIGAGISGIGTACHLARECPDKRVVILERRQAIGGTWDLFRYPGIRSDSDMTTFGFGFRPWADAKLLADGTTIRNYVIDTAREYGVDKKIQFGLKITSAEWFSDKQQWVVTATDEATGETRTFTASFLVAATGYYSYDHGYLPSFPGEENFKGVRVHPQHWPEALDYRGKKVVVIGSGATAVTLVPSMANDVAHITMLQRSPTYMMSVPAVDPARRLLGGILPKKLVMNLTRQFYLRRQRLFYRFARAFPKQTRAFMLGEVKRRLPKGYDMAHFTPKYMPWDERVCAVADGDLFKAIRSGKASVVTDTIERFVEDGILLKSGQKLEADLIITATGLDIQVLGGLELRVDGVVQKPGQNLLYKAVLVENVPNFAVIIGYTNLSWTLKVDLAAQWLCLLLKQLDERNAKVVTPRAPPGEAVEDENIFGALQAGYVRRAGDKLMRQGRTGPWRVSHNYESDKRMLAELGDPRELEWQ